MPDSRFLDNGVEASFTAAVDTDAQARDHAYVKVEFGPDDTQTQVTASVGLPVNPVQETAGVGVGAAADAEAAGNGSVIGLLKRLRTLLSVGAASLTKAEDAVHADGDAGVMVLAVRKDAAVALAGADGDYHPLLVDNQGRLWTNIGSMPAAARTTDAIAAALQTDALMNGLTVLTPKFKSLTVAAAQTDAAVVAAVASKKLRVLALSHQCGATATTATYESDGGSDTRLHKVPAGANGGQILPFNPLGWFETLSGEALIVTTGAGSDTEITLSYVEI